MNADERGLLTTKDTKRVESIHKSYPEYKPSGVEWLGEIPGHWKLMRLKFVSWVNMGQSPSSEDCNSEGSGEPFLQGNAEFGEQYPTAKLYCPNAPKHAPARSYLLSVRAPVGALNIADQRYGIGRGLCAIVPDNEYLENSFCFYLIEVAKTELHSKATGSTYDAVSAEDVRNMGGVVPPLPEQRAIAAFLDRETARIDALVAKKERLVELLQEKRAALISHAVTKGLDSGVEMKDSGVEWLGEIPGHWETRKINHLFRYIGSGTTPRSDDFGWYDGHIPWVTSAELRENVITDTEKKVTHAALREFSGLKLYRPGTLLVAMYGATIGRLGILGVEATVNQACCALSGPLETHKRFVFYWLWAHKGAIICLSVGGGQPNIGQETIRQLRISLPPLPEQRGIAAFLDRETARIDALVAKVGEAIERLREYRTALISAAVTGKIDVRGVPLPSSNKTRILE